MSKIQNAYECDACHALFQCGDKYDSNAAKGMDLRLKTGQFGSNDAPRWDYDHVCDSCRRKAIDALRAVLGKPTDEPDPDYREVGESKDDAPHD